MIANAVCSGTDRHLIALILLPLAQLNKSLASTLVNSSKHVR